MGERMFGPYRLDGLIGRGGMGEVHRAYDTVKKRTVAVKLLPVGLATDRSFQARFRRESEVAARLREPHVIPIHDFGEIDGQLFIDMRLVDGVDLATVLDRDGPLAPARAVHIVGQVASALDAAHGDGLIHRDVKPSNVLISGSGADEFAYLIDFGIARNLLGSATSGATAGTLAYMAPERFVDPGGGDARIDVYALACLLHELLTGRRPFPGQEAAPLMYAHLNSPPPRPSTTRVGVPPGFDDVVARGMAKNPQHRYPSGSALAAAARSVAGTASRTHPGPFPVADGPSPPGMPTWPATAPATSLSPPPGNAHPDTPAARRPWSTRAGWAAAGIAALVVVVVLATFLSQGPGPTAAGPDPEPDVGATALGTIAVRDYPVGVAVTADGARALVANSGSDAVSVIDVADGQVLDTIAVQVYPVGVAVTPDGTRALVTNHSSDSVSVIDVAGRRVLDTITVQDAPDGVAVTPDGTRALVTNSGSDAVSVIDVADGRVLATIAVQDIPVAVAVTPDGTRALVANIGSSSVSVIDVAGGQVLGTITGQDGPSGVAVTPDGTRALVANNGANSVSVIDVAGGQVLETITVQDIPIGVAVTPDGTRALVANNGANSVSVIDIAGGRVLETITVQDDPDSVAVTPDGTRALVANNGSASVSVIDTGLRPYDN